MDRPIAREQILCIPDTQAARTTQASGGLSPSAFDQPARDDGRTTKEGLAHIISAALQEGSTAPNWSAGGRCRRRRCRP